MKSKHPGRRRFLQKGAALAGLALTPAGLALTPKSASGEALAPASPETNSLENVLYGQRSRYVNTARLLEGDDDHGRHGPRPNPYRPSAKTPIRDSVGIITPSSLHFTTQHNWGIPDINPTVHRLTIHGMVDRPLVHSMEDLKRFPYVSRIHFIECIANRGRPSQKNVNETHGRMACSEWAGVPLSVLLQESGVHNGASWVVAEGSEAGKHTKSVPLGKCMDDVLVAFAQNGEPIRPDNGFPLRLLVPGFEGIYQVKFLTTLKVVDRPYYTFQEQSRYLAVLPNPTKSAGLMYELGPKSVITYPSGEDRLPSRGYYNVTGLAWSGSGAIRRVEVSTDGGRTWKDAQLQDPVLRMAHTRFNYAWNWGGEEALLQSRCTDELGQIQPSLAEFLKFWGLTTQEFSRTANTNLGHNNFIHPWKVNSNGIVENGLQG
jgi:sulfane dehydrogenase subunit SoxC